MPKLNRYFQKIFGSTANPTEISTFGSLAAGSPAYTTDPGVIQSLGNYLRGWYGGVVGAYSPTIEDMNALFYLVTYQLAYLMEQGIPEYSSTTTYYIGSIVKDSTGTPYVSLTDNNIGNVPSTSFTSWRAFTTYQTVFQINGSGSVSSTQSGTLFTNFSNLVPFSLTLPQSSQIGAGFTFTVKDEAGTFGQTVAGTLSGILLRATGDVTTKIEGISSSFPMHSRYGEYTFYYNGTDWWQI